MQQSGSRAGLVGVGAPHGVFAPGPERALRFAVLSGVPVVKLAPGGDVASCPDELFVNAGTLTEGEAQRVLASALEAAGSPPRARNPIDPTPSELDGIRTYVRQLQQHFTFARSGLVARN